MREILRALIADVGLTEAAKRLGFPRNTVANGAAGGGMRNATRIVLADRLRTAR